MIFSPSMVIQAALDSLGVDVLPPMLLGARPFFSSGCFAKDIARILSILLWWMFYRYDFSIENTRFDVFLFSQVNL